MDARIPRTQDSKSGSDGTYGTPRAHGEGMDTRSRAVQEQLPNVLERSSNLARGHPEKTGKRRAFPADAQRQDEQARRVLPLGNLFKKKNLYKLNK